MKSPMLEVIPSPRLLAWLVAAAMAFGEVGVVSVTHAEAGSVDGLWREVPDLQGRALTKSAQVDGRSWPRKFRVFALSESRMETRLKSAPMEFTPAGKGRAIVSLPLPDGRFTRVRVERSPILSPAMQVEYPNITAYRVQGIDIPSLSGRLSWTADGFRGMVISHRGSVYIDPYLRPGLYISYWKRDAQGERWQCRVGELRSSHAPGLPGNGVFDVIGPGDSARGARAKNAAAGVTAFIGPSNPSGNVLTTYDFVMTATGEYTEFFGGAAAAANAIAATMNRVVGIYERELAISFVLVDMLIYTDKNTDPFTTGATVDGTLLSENQAVVDSEVGSANYDIAHIVSQGSGGGFAPGNACSANKAKGGTSLATPSGDVFDVDFVSHEVGHQLSGSHTWNGTTGSCTAGQWTSHSAYEPGSGSTIMAYAGICGAQDVQPNSDDYFHTRSFDQITGFVIGAGSCGSTTATGNSAPIVDAGPDYTIPQSTPFRLTAAAIDPDGDPLTYNWEQFDLGTRDGFPQSTFTTGPLFRSVEPTVDPVRTLPRMAALLSGTPTPWEVLPAVNRDLTFRATARDNRANGGGVDYDTMVVHVQGDPFLILEPGSADRAECGLTTPVSWQVGGGSVAGDVALLLSLNSGPFNTHLPSTPNDGSETVPVPAGVVTSSFGTDARFQLQAIGNIFFALSEEFDIVDTLDPDVTAPADVVAECTGPAGTPVDIGAGSAGDVCDPLVPVSNDAPSLFPLGDTVVTWTAGDDAGNFGADTQTVTIADTTAPEIELSVTPATLWPPNHKLVTVQATVEVSDVCDSSLEVRLVSIVSNEPANGAGDGNTPADIQGAAFGTDDRLFRLRAERNALGDGRIYLITYEVEDGGGNVSADTAIVRVAHNR